MAERFEFALLGYTWSNPPDAPDEVIVLPAGWVESGSPFIPGFWGTMILDDAVIITALPSGMASRLARGFDEPNEEIRWFLRQRQVS